jgi:hypothetical protein
LEKEVENESKGLTQGDILSKKGAALEEGAKAAFEKKFGRTPDEKEVQDFIETYGPQNELDKETTSKFETAYEEKNGEKPTNE